MTTRTPAMQEQATPTRGAWGFSMGDDGRVALTHSGQVVTTAACHSAVAQVKLYALYARLVSAHGAREGRVAP